MYSKQNTFQPKNIYNKGVNLVDEVRDWMTYEVECDTSYGTMAVCQLFHGIQIAYFSFQANSCFMRDSSYQHILEISYCYKGRYECQYTPNHLTYQGEGDIAVGILKNHQEQPTFPTSIYEGVALIIDLDQEEHELSNMVEGISINFLDLVEKYCAGYHCTVMKAASELHHIFERISSLKYTQHLGYLRLMVLEILFLLSELNPLDDWNVSAYYSKATVEKIKALKTELTHTLDQKITLSEWARRYDLSLTTMKECFKFVYGKPIYTYQKQYRMQEAAHLLLTTDHSILDIAGAVGYSNPNKFSSAFKAEIGVSPRDYRHQKRKCPFG